MSFKILEKSVVVKGRQDVTYKAAWTHSSGIKVRVNVKSDSYAFQCHAYLEAFSPTEQKWNRVVSLHHAEMTTVNGLIHYPEFQGNKSVPATAGSHFMSDVNNLLTQYDNLMS